MKFGNEVIEGRRGLVNGEDKGARRVWYSNPKSFEKICKNKERVAWKKIAVGEAPRIGNYKLSSDMYLILSKLAKSTKLHLQLPETIIYGYGFHSPTFIYTNQSHILKIKPNLNPMHLETIYKIFEYHRQCSKKTFPTPLAIIKSPTSSCSRVIMKASEFLNEVKTGFKSDIIIQRYIIPKGNKAFKIRQFSKEPNFSYFSISNKQRLDGKKEQKQFKPKNDKKVIQRMNSAILAPTNHSNTKKNSFLITRKNSLLNQYDEVEILNAGQKYLNDRSMATDLVELGAFEIPFKYFKKPRKKLPEPRVSSQVRRATIVISNKMSELDKYLQDIWNSSLNIEQTLEDLYKELKGFDSVTTLDYVNKEEISINIHVINELRNMFLIDSNSIEKINTFEITATNAFSIVENWSNVLKKLIGSMFFARQGEHIENLVIEFCEDFLGNIFFLKLKNFTVERHTVIDSSLQTVKNSFKCPGKFCNKGKCYDEYSDLTGNCENKPKVFKILLKTLEEYDDKNIEQAIRTNFQREAEVCSKCFYQYLNIEKNKVLRVQKSVDLIDVSKFGFSRSIGRLKIGEVNGESRETDKKEKKSNMALKFCLRRKELIQASRQSEFINTKKPKKF